MAPSDDESEGEAPIEAHQAGAPDTPTTTVDRPQPAEPSPVEVASVTFINARGEESTLVSTGEPLIVRIAYRAIRRIDRPVFGVALYTENGTHLNGPNTRFAGLEIPSIEGEGHVDYEIEALPLLAGRYDVTVAITDADMAETFVHLHRAYSFRVQPTPGLPERWGLVYIPARWSFHPGDE